MPKRIIFYPTYILNTMIIKSTTGAYKAPKCETEGVLFEELLCQSPSGTTEDFTEEEPFTW